MQLPIANSFANCQSNLQSSCQSNCQSISNLDFPMRGSDWARRADTDGQKRTRFDFGGKHWGKLQYTSTFYGTRQACPHRGWTWKGHVGSKINTKKHHWKIKANQYPNKFGDDFVSNQYKTKMTALARSIDLKSCWT